MFEEIKKFQQLDRTDPKKNDDGQKQFLAMLNWRD